MDEAKVGLQELAELTQFADPTRNGVSFQLIAFLATKRRGWSRETTKPGTADLIEDALSVPRGTLFTREVIYSKSDKRPEENGG
jgi:hypothetical protein